MLSAQAVKQNIESAIASLVEMDFRREDVMNGLAEMRLDLHEEDPLPAVGMEMGVVKKKGSPVTSADVIACVDCLLSSEGLWTADALNFMLDISDLVQAVVANNAADRLVSKCVSV